MSTQTYSDYIAYVRWILSELTAKEFYHVQNLKEKKISDMLHSSDITMTGKIVITTNKNSSF